MASTLWRGNHRTASKDTSEAPRQSKVSDLPEAEAIRLARGGDARGFERVYRLHCRQVYALCVRMTRNFADAEDLTQEAFLQVFRRIHTFRGESAFSTWLHKVAFNIVLMHLRKKHKTETSLEEINEPDERSGAKCDLLAGPDLRLAGAIDRINLQRGVEQLPPGCKAVFVLYDIQGCEHKEIAEILGCSVGNSKSQVHKARRRLRDILRQTRRNRTRQKLQPAGSSLEPVPT